MHTNHENFITTDKKSEENEKIMLRGGEQQGKKKEVSKSNGKEGRPKKYQGFSRVP